MALNSKTFPLLPSDAGTGRPILMSSRRERKRLATLNLATLNVRGCASQIKRNHLFKVMENRNLACLGITETKMKESLIEDEGPFKLIIMPSTSIHHGVGFGVRKELAGPWRSISNRVGALNLKMPNLEANIIVVYAPTSPVCEKHPEEREKFYKDIEEAWAKDKVNILLGDFNSKVGRRCDDYPKNAGSFSMGTRNEGGASLLSFAQRKDMILTNTLFKKKFGMRATWCGQVGAKKIYNQIDYILVPNKCRHLITNSESYNTRDVETDHRLVVTSLQMKNTPGKKKRWFQTSSKPDLDALQDPSVCENLKERVFEYKEGHEEE
ncbi:craniofacial development protein 2-like, partial [Rhopilema esculentum]|uniref:craniofacial development protein 2-like n=1 Tax=Rhopilema esculentum TaxID=499914 RepID=UPI0031D1FCDA